MSSSNDMHPAEVIRKASDELKKELKMPPWARFVKTSCGKARPPDSNDWYVMRAASVLRKVGRFGPVGTNKLRVKYGTKMNRGHKPEEFRRGSGKIIRSILQQLEEKGYVKKEKKGNHAGRVLTPKGRSFLDKLGKNDGKQSGEQSGKRAPKADSSAPAS